MRPTLLLLALALSACGPDLSTWKGTWSGNAALNTGRQPEVVPGRVVFGDELTAELTLGPLGTPRHTFGCTLAAASGDAAKATFTVPQACAVTVAEGDDCVYVLAFTTASAQRDGETLLLNASGRLTTTCTAGSSAVDLGAELSATRQ